MTGEAMQMIAVKYAKTDPRNGNLNYRRRVPKTLENSFPSQTMLVKALGKGEAALVAYGWFHERIEHMKTLAESGVTGLSPAEQRVRLKAMLEGWDAVPYSSGFEPSGDLNEWTWWHEAADKLLNPYQDRETGEWSSVPPEVEAEAFALLKGVPEKPPELTPSASIWRRTSRRSQSSGRSKSNVSNEGRSA